MQQAIVTIPENCRSINYRPSLAKVEGCFAIIWQFAIIGQFAIIWQIIFQPWLVKLCNWFSMSLGSHQWFSQKGPFLSFFCTCSLAFSEMVFTSCNSLGCWITDPNQPTFTGWHGWSGELARLHFSHYQWKWQATDTQQFECECVSLSISGSSVGSYTQQPTVEWSEWPTQHWESHWLVLVSCYIGIHTGLLYQSHGNEEL